MDREQPFSKKDLKERGIDSEELEVSEENFEDEGNNKGDKEIERVKQEVTDLGILEKINAGEHLNLKEQLVWL